MFKRQSQFLNFLIMITTVKHKASIGSHHAIPQCSEDMVEWGK